MPNMNTVKAVTEDAVRRLVDLYRFISVTVFTYNGFRDFTEEQWKQRKVCTLTIPVTNEELNHFEVCNNLNCFEITYLGELSLQLTVSVFETWFFDMLRIILSDPNRINKKRQLEVGEILRAKNMEELLQFVVDGELNKLRYERPVEWFVFIRKFVKTSAPSAQDIERIAEIKASRDIAVHNRGFANKTYVEKAGALARAKDGERLWIHKQYAGESWAFLKNVVEQVGSQVSEKIDPPSTS